MILDSSLNFVKTDAPQAVTATAASTNIVDLLNPRDLGIGDNDLNVVVIVDKNWASSTSAAVLTAQFQGAPDNGSGSPGTYHTFAASEGLTVTQLTATTDDTLILNIEVPARSLMGADGRGMTGPLPRFYRMNWSVSGGESFTAGNVLFAGIVLNPERPTYYPSGFSVSN